MTTAQKRLLEELRWYCTFNMKQAKTYFDYVASKNGSFTFGSRDMLVEHMLKMIETAAGIGDFIDYIEFNDLVESAKEKP